MVAIRDVLRVLAVLALLPGIFVQSLLAGDQSCLHRTVSVTVVDRNWAPILDLTPDDFRGEFRGKPVKILSVTPDAGPHRIVIILDASGSFGFSPGSRGPSKWQLGRVMASHLVESKLPDAKFALLIFNTKIQEEIDFSRDPRAVAERLQQIGSDSNYQKTKVKGSTALWDTVLVGLGLLHDPTSGDIFYLLTDGGENASRATSKEVRRRLAASGSRIFISLLEPIPTYRNRVPQGEASPEEVNEMARATGGAIFGPITQTASGLAILGRDADPNETVSDDLRGFYRAMLRGYRVGIELPSGVDKWREWKLELRKERQQWWKDTQLGYTHDLVPCKELLN